MELETSPRLQLSAPTASPRKRSAWRCMAISCIVFAACVVGVVVCALLYITWTVIDTARNPHKELLHNGTAPITGGSVVRPLIGVETKYDLAVTVYARKADDPEWIAAELERYHAERGAGKDVQGADEALAGFVGVQVQEVQIEPIEEILFAGIVASGLSLTSKSKDVTFTFDLPLQRFYDETLYGKDVRLGVGIIPTAPSKLDRLDAWTDWRPQIGLVPKLADGVLNASKIPSDPEHQSKIVDAIKHMAISFPLLEFHQFDEKCPTGNTTEESASDEEDEEDFYAFINGDDEMNDEKKDVKKNHNNGMVEKKRNAYIVSRSHVYIINETRLFNLKAFDKKHKDLRETSCGQEKTGFRASKWLCHRDYKSNGHWETRFVLFPANDGGRKELAYGPYLGNLQHAAGPRHIHRLPVTIGNCSGIPRDRSGDPETMTVTHTMRFSSLTPVRVQMLDGVSQPTRMAENATHADVMFEHDAWEQLTGLLGSKAEGAHPWRRFLISFAADAFISLPIGLLSMVYWYTRTTSAGISTTATYLGAFADIAKSLGGLGIIIYEGDHFLAIVLAVVLEAWNVVPAILRMRVVWPLAFAPGSRWQLSRSRPSHRERQSMRVESQITLPMRLLLISACFAVIYLPAHYLQLHLLAPHVVRTPKQSVHVFLRSPAVESVFGACALAGEILQAEQNRRAGTLAGDFAVTAYLGLARQVVGWLYFVPWVIGKFEVRQALDVDDVVWAGVAGWKAWQAATLPRVEQKEPDGEDE